MLADCKELTSFLKEIRNDLQNDLDEKMKPSPIEHIQVFTNECVFITDFNKGELIYENGVEEMFGYSGEEINFDFVFKGYHPQECETLIRVIRAAITYTIENPSGYPENLLYLNYRRRRKDNSYISVLSQTSLYRDKDNSLKSLTRLTDISFTKGDNSISYMFDAKDMEPEIFKEQIHSAYVGFFTDREIQVIMEMKKGLTSRQIAKELSISELTVATHRKNIFRKSVCHNSNELMNFCRMNGMF